jgi:predicted glycosyltransferase
MRILFDLKHPAQVHFFKHPIRSLTAAGDDVLVTARAKDETTVLLGMLGIPYVCLSRPGKGLIGMGMEFGWRLARMLRVVRRFRPDVLVARTGVTVGPVGRILGVPSVIFDDTEFAGLQISLSAPFATVVCTGLGYGRRFPGKEIRFNAPPHLACTHPSRFTPRADVLRAHGVDPDQPYVVLRLKAWRALHDWGARGPTNREIGCLVEALRLHGRPIISAERALPVELQGYLNPLPVDAVHDLLAFARLYVGEGSCMAAEAACLGTPAIFLSPASRRGYLDALEQRYGHVTTVQTVSQAVERAREWLTPGMKEKALAARDRLVRECEDPVEFTMRVIRRYGRG